MRRALALALTLTLATPASAHAPRIPPAASEHVAAANRAFVAKQYDQALEQLRAAYQLAPRPEFLLTFAQIYRASGDRKQAIEACRMYLATAPNGPLAGSARKLADLLEAEQAAAAPPPAPPSTTTTTTTTPPLPSNGTTPPPSPATTTPLPDAALPSVNASAPRHADHHKRNLAIALGVTGAVVVVGLAVGLGVGLTASSSRRSTFGDVPFNP